MFDRMLRCESITPFGHAGAAAREDHRRQRRPRWPRAARASASGRPAGSTKAVTQREELRDARRTPSSRLRETPCRRIGSIDAFRQEDARRDDRADAALLDRRRHGFAADGEVEVDRRPCPPASCRCWPARRRPMPGAAGRCAARPARCGAASARAAGAATSALPNVSLRPVESAIAERPPAPLRGPDEPRGQRVRRRTPPVASLAAELHDRQPRFVRRSRRDGSGAPNATVTGYGMRSGQLPEEPAALEAEDAAPDAIQVHRDDGHVEALDDLLEAALERQQVAGAADGAFGEDADHVAGAEFAARAR